MYLLWYCVLIDVSVCLFSVFCPNISQRRLRKQGFCRNQNLTYVCLYDDNESTYLESCEVSHVLQMPGFKFVIRGGLDSEPCSTNRYQPIYLLTNESSHCIFQKTICSSLGQVTHDGGTSKDDVKCRCDYSRGYAFVSLNSSYCNPSIDDCSCYAKTCQENQVLSKDYTCISKDDLSAKQFGCPSIRKENGKKNIIVRTLESMEDHKERREKEGKYSLEYLYIRIDIFAIVITVLGLLVAIFMLVIH